MSIQIKIRLISNGSSTLVVKSSWSFQLQDKVERIGVIEKDTDDVETETECNITLIQIICIKNIYAVMKKVRLYR